MKANHSAEVAALTQVVRQMLTEVEAGGTPVGPAAKRSMALVERWVAGEAVTAEALLEGTKQANQEGEQVGKSKKLAPEVARNASWATTAVGNLCWMASKARGWQDGTRVVMDAVVYADAQSDGRKRAEADLAKARTAALAKPSALPEAPRSVRPKPLSIGAELEPFVGAVAGAWLAKLSAVREPDQQGSASALRALLRKHGYPVHPSVLTFEERYGGLVMAESPGEEGMDWTFGAYACLKFGGHSTPRGAKGQEKLGLVPVAYSANDNIYFLDAQGLAWAHDTIEGPIATPFATDLDHLVARILIGGMGFDLRFKSKPVERDGRQGAALAKQLGLKPIPEATDALGAAWGNEQALVEEWAHTTTSSVKPSDWRNAPWHTLAVGRGVARLAKARARPARGRG